MSFVDSLLSQMTLEEKVGQMNLYNGFYDATGPAPEVGDDQDKYEDIRAGRVGGMLNVFGVEEVAKYQELAVENSRLGIPMLFGLDVIHGQRTVFPIPIAEAASWNLALIKQSARIAATEAAAMGVNWTFAPMMDIGRDARWGRVMEGAGEDTYLGTKVAVARVKGFQGDDLKAPDTIAACAKHFAGYGFAESGKDYNTVDVGLSTLYNIILPPFKACVEAGVLTVMNAFNELNGIPATGDAFLQRDILKGEWGFEGFVVSDWGSIKEMLSHGFAENLQQAAKMAVTAGSDMDMEAYAYHKHLATLVKDGQVKMETVDDAVRRILMVKEKLGLFDNPYKYCDTNREKIMLYHPEHLDAALQMAQESMVLLKNEQQFLPLKKEGQTIAVIGQMADSKNSMLGNWRFGAEDHTGISVMEGLQNYPGNTYHYRQGVKLYEGEEYFYKPLITNNTDKTGMDEAVETAKNADLVIMVIGENSFHSGEARSRTDLGFPGLQQVLLEKVHAANPNIVLVTTSGRPLDLSWSDAHIPAILHTWQLGTQAGRAIAQALYGDVNPSGKLPMTFPRSVAQVPIYYNHKNTGRPQPKPDIFSSGYIDMVNDPLYPFGFGLSYARFAYSDLAIEKNGDAVDVQVTVKNIGEVNGAEIVQLYIRDCVASVTRPVKALKGFKKIWLEAGASERVTLQLTRESLGFYNNRGEFVVENGAFEVMVGGEIGEFSI